ncbi:hypothetical protein ACJX0J_012333 [Zea mays]
MVSILASKLGIIWKYNNEKRIGFYLKKREGEKYYTTQNKFINKQIFMFWATAFLPRTVYM